jgi:DNA-binding NtrC family response regulator
MKKNLLIIDDDAFYRMYLKQLFQPLANCYEAYDANSILQIIKQNQIDLAVVDLNFDGNIEGINHAKTLNQFHIPFIILSAEDNDDLTEQVYQLGCLDFFSKGLETNYLGKLNRYLNQNNKQINDSIKSYFSTKNEPLINDISQISQAFLDGMNTLIIGETGSGKGHVAQFLHEQTDRKQPFIAINCATIPQNLFESEIFGHKKGSFSGAERDKIGLLAAAHNGILFLDEVCSLNSEHQAKLLKVIEEREYYPVGSTEKIKVNFKLIAACQPSIKSKIENGLFRLDLYYRLAAVTLHLPNLGQRLEDFEMIIKFICKKGRKIILKEDAIAYLAQQSWPGNVRELQQFLRTLQSKELGIFTKVDLQKLIQNENLSSSPVNHSTNSMVQEVGLKKYLQQIQHQIITETFQRNKNNVRKTVEELQISFSTFYATIGK